MSKMMMFCGAAVLALPNLLVAKDYPLAFKTLTAQQAMSFPAQANTFAMLKAAKPASLLKAPPAVSQRPLYGELGAGTNMMLLRLDESKGNGRGYDRLIVDFNRNGDLTDDPEASCTPTPGRALASVSLQQVQFGPIQAQESLKIGSDRPVYFAELYLFTQSGTSVSLPPNTTLGELLWRPGWYMEATVEVASKTHTVDLVDGNGNSRLGDAGRPITYLTGTNGGETNWMFEGGDRVLVDCDVTGRISNILVENQSAPFAPILYLDATPYKASVAADGRTLTLDAWTDPLAELAIQPHGDQVASLQVAWEKTPGNWILLRPDLESGKTKVPPGNYRLYSANLKVKTASGDYLIMSGTKSAPGGSIKAGAGEATPFKCGSPLQIGLTSQATTSSPSSSSSLLGALAESLFGQSGPAQDIQATLVGTGGETYSSPYLTGGQNLLSTPPAPTFAVLNTDGKQVASGSLEYG